MIFSILTSSILLTFSSVPDTALLPCGQDGIRSQSKIEDCRAINGDKATVDNRFQLVMQGSGWEQIWKDLKAHPFASPYTYDSVSRGAKNKSSELRVCGISATTTIEKIKDCRQVNGSSLNLGWNLVSKGVEVFDEIWQEARSSKKSSALLFGPVATYDSGVVQLFTHTQAVNYCSGLSGGGWQLPTRLQTKTAFRKGMVHVLPDLMARLVHFIDGYWLKNDDGGWFNPFYILYLHPLQAPYHFYGLEPTDEDRIQGYQSIQNCIDLEKHSKLANHCFEWRYPDWEGAVRCVRDASAPWTGEAFANSHEKIPTHLKQWEPAE